MFCQKKELLEKASTLIRFEYFLLGEELKAQTSISNDRYKFFKGQINVSSNHKEKDKSDEDKSDGSKTDQRFNTILKYLKNNGRTTNG